MITIRRMMPLLGLLAVPVGAADPGDAVTRIAAKPARDGWFVCDAIEGPVAAFVGKPDAKGRSTVTLLDRRSGRFDTRTYTVGAVDAGAGQRHWPLTTGGRAAGDVHGVDPGMIADDGATIVPIVGVTIGGRSLDCRWLSHMRFIGLDARRGVAVTDEDGTLVYRSFDFAKQGAATHPDGVQQSSAPTLELRGGTQTADGFRFPAGGVTAIEIDTRGGVGPAMVRVTEGGRIAGRDALVGFSYAPLVPGSDTLGPAAVWDGDGLDRCRASGGDVGACLVARMRATGATPAAIAYARRLAAKDDPGYISGWRQAGPVGIATVTFPFRANMNETSALVPAGGVPIALDGWQPDAADRMRADWQAFARAHPDATAWPSGEVSAPKAAPGQPLTIRWRLPLRDCHACATLGTATIAYRFDAGGHPAGSALEAIDPLGAGGS